MEQLPGDEVHHQGQVDSLDLDRHLRAPGHLDHRWNRTRLHEGSQGATPIRASHSRPGHGARLHDVGRGGGVRVGSALE